MKLVNFVPGVFKVKRCGKSKQGKVVVQSRRVAHSSNRSGSRVAGVLYFPENEKSHTSSRNKLYLVCG